MSNEPPENKTRFTDAEEQDLWDHMMRDVTPLVKPLSAPSSNQDKKPPAPKAERPIPRPQKGHTQKPQKQATHHTQPAPRSAPQDPQLDHRTEGRLRKGKIKIDQTLDLHGLNQVEAHASLTQTVKTAYHHGMRCLLIITGKGNKDRHHNPFSSGHRGVLKQRVPQWLEQEPLKSMILKSQTARPQHGGEGAMYLYIKRKRDL